MDKYIQSTFKNKEKIEKSEKIGCYNCKKILKKEEVEFLKELDDTETGLCKHCGYDTIITEDLLKEDGVIIYECLKEDAPIEIEGLELYKQANYGIVRVNYYRR